MESNSEKDLKERFNEAEKQAKLGHNDRAHDMFTDVIERCQNYLTFSPNVQMPSNTVQKLLSLALNNRGHLKYLRVDFDDAVSDYTKALVHEPTLAVAYYNRGLIHYRLGRWEAAIRDQQQALHLDPAFTSAQQCLTQAQMDRQADTPT